MLLRVLTPAAIVIFAAAVAAMLVYTRPEARSNPPARAPLLVSVLEAEPGEVRFSVASRGRVTPRTQTDMVSEVAGTVVELAPQLVAGGILAPDQVMLRIDARQYEAALQQARAALARAETELATEQALAGYARSDYERLARLQATELPASELVLRKPQLAAAAANVDAARAALRKATDDLDRTVMRAPYRALVRSRRVDVGQYVAPGTPLATVAAVDDAEVRLPVTLADLRYLPVDAVERGDVRLPVTLSARVGGELQQWQAQVVRTEGVLDPDSQVLHLVARVSDPYALNADSSNATALRFGTFVAAEISGRVVQGVYTLPRHALLDGDRVWRLDDESRLQPVNVSVLRRAESVVHIDAGLAPGDRICITPTPDVAPGTPVRIRDAQADQTLPETDPGRGPRGLRR